jgi:uncharacterized coiled-coil protein SlyX
MQIHVFHHADDTTKALLNQVLSGLHQIKHQQEIIVATQQEMVTKLNDIGVELNKVGAETDALLQKIAELQAAVDAQPNATPELEAAVAAVAAQAKVVDDKVPDAPTP